MLTPGAESGSRTVRPFTKIVPFHPITAFSPSGGFRPCQDFRHAAFPTPKQSWGCPEMGGSLLTLPGASLLWKRDSAKGLWHWEVPFSPILSFAPLGEPTTEILYLCH